MSEFKFGAWYPIETAPWDQKITVWREAFYGHEACAIEVTKKHFSNGDSDWLTDRGRDGSQRFRDPWAPHFTHWMPLPPPPEEMAARPSAVSLIERQCSIYANRYFDARKGRTSEDPARLDGACDALEELLGILKEAGLE